MTSKSKHLCQACGADHLSEIEGFENLPRVTSDSKPFRSGGRLFVCGGCGMVQKVVDTQWLDEIGEIYRDYEMYHQSTSKDQAVFDPVSGRPAGRCEVLARHLIESGALPISGSLLDVGAGSGAMLEAFSAASDNWRLFGLDLDDRKEQALKAIPRFEQLYTVAPETLTRKFELLTLIHSLEHFTNPLSMLQTLRQLISPGGGLFIQVNNAEKTAFDLVVADHLSHFTPPTLSYMISQAGFSVEIGRTDWVNKEISLLVSTKSLALSTREDTQHALVRTNRGVKWLHSMLSDAASLSGRGHFGVFGTSVAATWLASGLGDAIEFFVDEDPARKGRQHLGKPIFTPEEVPEGSTVYLAFLSQVSSAIAKRLAHLPLQFATPPSNV